MRWRPIIIACIIGFVIRVWLLLDAPGAALQAYDTLVQSQRILDSGLLLTGDPVAWQGTALYSRLPLFPYLLAFSAMLFPLPLVALVVPNALISLLPIPVALLASEITRDDRAVSLAAFASLFVPQLYRQTLLTTSPLTLALPLLLLVYYYFLRLGRTPRDQLPFLVSLTLLALTSPLSLLLVPAMGFTLLLTRIQRTRFSIAQAEAALFASFVVLWANSIFLKPILLGGWNAFVSPTAESLSLIDWVGFSGLLPLAAGVYAASSYIRDERSPAVHAVAALAVTAVLSTLLGFLTLPVGSLLLGLALSVLLAAAVMLYREFVGRSRVPGLYRVLLAPLLALFVLTSVVPALAGGVAAYAQSPTAEDWRILSILSEEAPGATVLWDARHGFFTRYHGFGHVVDSDAFMRSTHDGLLERLSALSRSKSEVQLVETLNDVRADVWVTSDTEGLPITPRCFKPLYRGDMEVYAITCIVQ